MKHLERRLRHTFVTVSVCTKILPLPPAVFVSSSPSNPPPAPTPFPLRDRDAAPAPPTALVPSLSVVASSCLRWRLEFKTITTLRAASLPSMKDAIRQTLAAGSYAVME